MPKFRIRIGSSLPSVLEYGEPFVENGTLYVGMGEGKTPVAISGSGDIVGIPPPTDNYATLEDLQTEIARAQASEASLALEISSMGGATIEDRHYVGASGEVPFQGGWTNWGHGYAPLSYYKDAQGFVHLEGMISSGNHTVPIFTLPSDHIPTDGNTHMYHAFYNANAVTTLRIDPQGNVYVGNYSSWVSLDGIFFRTV